MVRRNSLELIAQRQNIWLLIKGSMVQSHPGSPTTEASE
jgi:hypothetical protein